MRITYVKTDMNLNLDEVCNNLYNESEQLHKEFVAIISVCEKSIERYYAIYEIKENGKWAKVSRYDFNKFKGIKKINGTPYIGHVN